MAAIIEYFKNRKLNDKIMDVCCDYIDLIRKGDFDTLSDYEVSFFVKPFGTFADVEADYAAAGYKMTHEDKIAHKELKLTATAHNIQYVCRRFMNLLNVDVFCEAKEMMRFTHLARCRIDGSIKEGGVELHIYEHRFAIRPRVSYDDVLQAFDRFNIF